MHSRGQFLLGWLLLLAVADGAPQQQPTSTCPLLYDPVVDLETNVLFYNECLAKLQLGTQTKIVRRDALEQAAVATAGGSARRLRAAGTTTAASGPTAQHYMKLAPKPAAGSTEDVVVGMDVIRKYAEEGFLYVGRPGFLSSEDSAVYNSNMAEKDRSAAEAAPLSMHGARVSLRILYPEGDMYMKIWNASELQNLQTTHGSDLTAAYLAQPNIPNDETDAAADIDQLSQQETANHHRRTATAARRLLPSTAAPNRTEITAAMLSGPYSAVSYINITRYNAPTAWCTGVMAGPTSRLILTAARCLYDFDAVTGTGKGYHQAFMITPGQTRNAVTNTVAMPYGRFPGAMAEVMAQWMLRGNFDFDIGLLRLGVHVTLATKAPGSMGFNYSCTQKSFSLESAGYPADKGFTGSLWRQSLTTNAAMCSGSIAQKIDFAFAAGQDGSPLWTSGDNIIRYVMSKAGTAVPITPTYYSWILDFTNRTIINIVTQQLQGGPPTSPLFFKCDPVTKACVGARKANATAFHFHPVHVGTKYALRMPYMSLCLTANSTANITATNSTVSAYLSPCNTDGRFTFPSNQLWNVDITAAVNYISAARTDNAGYLSCGGENQPLLVRSTYDCYGQAACTWKLVNII
ncbi:hypothetical protein VaNZ11_006409 [Volvox africanus]|uniref:Peptidase S1 domain-containing protein n=1 Tax=Volvox africanus TaxID=51714 RepID=A0ABQ5S100_9CHLO|nr:hypothetical protein VaNZ11_006409 [Volvox africanus]